MDAGFTFKVGSNGIPFRLWIVLGIDDDGTTLIAGVLPSDHPRFDDACILEATDHPFLSSESCVDYELARLLPLTKRRKILRNIPFEQRLDERVLRKIQLGCIHSEFAAGEHKRFINSLIVR